MLATIPPPYDMLLTARRASATTSHMLDALAFSAAANAAETTNSDWDHLHSQAIDRVLGTAAYAAMEETAPLDLDIWDGLTYDDLPEAVVPRVLSAALHAACRFCNRTNEHATPIAELLSETGAEDQQISVTPHLSDDTKRGDLVEFVQKNSRTLFTPPHPAPIFAFMQQVNELAAEHPEHTVTWTFTHPATGEVLNAYDLSANA